jgi:hypothetical protein
MRLYSIQPLAVYDLLCHEGQFHSRPLAYPNSNLSYYRDDFAFVLAYEWLMTKMTALGLPRPAPDVYPIWAFFQWYGVARPKPDLRCCGLKDWGRSERKVLLTLEIPANQVLLSDYYGWLNCINYGHAGTNRESQAFFRRFDRAGGQRRWDQPLAEPWHQELLTSWDRVLDLETSRRQAGIKKADHAIQATFWAVTAEQVKAAVAFGGGRRREILPVPIRTG